MTKTRNPAARKLQERGGSGSGPHRRDRRELLRELDELEAEQEMEGAYFRRPHKPPPEDQD